VVDNYDIDKTVVIKAKIKPSYSNKTTIDQNYYSIADFIRNKGYDKYSENVSAGLYPPGWNSH